MADGRVRGVDGGCARRVAGVYRAASALALLMLAGLLGGLLFGNQDLALTCVLVVMLAAIALLPVAYSLANRQFEILDLGTWFSLYFLLTYGVRALYDVVVGSPILAATPDLDAPRAVHAALAASAAGLLAFRLGYAAPLGRAVGGRLPALPARWDGTRLILFSAALLGAGWLARGFYIFRVAGGPLAWLKMNKFIFLGGVQGVSYLERVGEFALLGLFALLTAARVSRRPWLWLLFGCALVPELAYALFSGTRKQLLAVALGIAVVVILTRPRGHRRSLRALGVFGLLGGLAVIAYPVLTRMRAGDYSLGDLVRVFPLLIEHPREALRVFMSRQFSLDSLILIMKGTEAGEPFSLGRELGLVGAAWIPRALWPDKPVISLGKILYENMFPQIFQPGTAVAVGVCGNLYWALGWVGIGVGMGGLGVAWRILDTWIVRPRGNLSSALILSVMFWSFFFFVEQHFVRLYSDELLRLAGALLAVFAIGSGGIWQRRKMAPTGSGAIPGASVLHGEGGNA